MSLNTEQQFAGNYVRLVNQNRELQQAFDNSTQLNNALHNEIRLKDKMIQLMAITNKRDTQKGNGLTTDIIKYYKNQALSELVAEQNKKAADNASI